MPAWIAIITPQSLHSPVQLAHGKYYAPHFEDLLGHGVGSCPQAWAGACGWCCVLWERLLPSPGYLFQGWEKPSAVEHALCAGALFVASLVLMPAPGSWRLQPGLLHPAPQRCLTWALSR